MKRRETNKRNTQNFKKPKHTEIYIFCFFSSLASRFVSRTHFIHRRSLGSRSTFLCSFFLNKKGERSHLFVCINCVYGPEYVLCCRCLLILALTFPYVRSLSLVAAVIIAPSLMCLSSSSPFRCFIFNPSNNFIRDIFLLGCFFLCHLFVFIFVFFNVFSGIFINAF